MFDSQALETAIGLALMFFILATVASMVVEVLSRLMKKRAGDLEKAIGGLLGEGPKDAEFGSALDLFKGTSVYRSVEQASASSAGKTRMPSYVSAKAFADATVEMLTRYDSKGNTIARKLDELPANLRDRLTPLVRESGDDLTKLKAGLEGWFDDTMSRTEGAYKRWSTMLLFFVGLGLAVLLNASTVTVAQNLWADTVTRQAVVDAADKTVSDSSPNLDLTSVGDAAAKLDAAQLPVGWNQDARHAFLVMPDAWNWSWWGTLIGFLLTGLLVMLGGPFWYDLLSKLVSLRTAGPRPPTASDDPGSATRRHLAAVVQPRTGARPTSKAEIQTQLATLLGAQPPTATTRRPRQPRSPST